MRAVTFEFGSLFPWFIVSLCGTVLLGLANVKSVELEFAPAPFGLLLQLANVFIVGFCINELLIIRSINPTRLHLGLRFIASFR